MTVSGATAALSVAGSLPAEPTSYVGRRAEIADVRRMLGTSSLVTLTGPGGVGKTRLALQVAEAARAAFSDDVVFAGLADLREPELLVNTVGERLGLGDRSARPPIERLVDQLRTRRLLLVLDNCEHLVEACAELVGALLASCPDLVVLATSRQSLGVAGERVFPVPPLAVPEPDDAPEQSDAVRLFVDRATAVVPSFAVTEDNVEDVTRLCRALDGLPLAIELAAVRLRSLSVRQLADRLNKRFTLLTGGRRWSPSRHATFQALIDWSHELCTEQERLLWARASVFSGSFDLDGAEEVCSGDGLDRSSVLDVLDGLIDKSILLREEGGDDTARYRLLETMRQYGEERLAALGEQEVRKRRHRDRYLRLTGRFEAEWIGPDQVAWINLLRREHANLRAALDFCLSDPAEAAVGLRLLRGCKEYWLTRGLNTEGRIWLDRMLAVVPAEQATAGDRAKALWNYAFLALIQGDLPAYEASLGRAAELAGEIGDEQTLAYVHHVRAYAALIGDEPALAADLFHAAAERFAEQGHRSGEVWARYNYGLALSLSSDLDEGRAVLHECIDACVERGEVFWRSWALWSLSAAEYLLGDMAEATRASLELLRLQQHVDDRVLIAFSLTVVAGCATHEGQPRRAARLFGAAGTVWQTLGASPSNYAAFNEPMHRDIELVTSAIGLEEAAAEFTDGARLGAQEAVRYALGEQEREPASPEPDPLTKRETEIAGLVAEGMTNREIADRLVIARRTAETHVDHIMTKLGFSSRAQIAAWVVASRR